MVYVTMAVGTAIGARPAPTKRGNRPNASSCSLVVLMEVDEALLENPEYLPCYGLLISAVRLVRRRTSDPLRKRKLL